MATRKSTQAAPAASVNESSKIVLSSPVGLTPKQLELVLETIACRALALERMLLDLSGRCGGGIDSSTLHASIDGAMIVANTIGAMADDANSATGMIVNGDWGDWTYGPAFAEARNGVQS